MDRGSSDERTAALTGWLDFYDHTAPSATQSIARLNELNNLLGSYTVGEHPVS